jgi:OTU-like cysteine protease
MARVNSMAMCWKKFIVSVLLLIPLSLSSSSGSSSLSSSSLSYPHSLTSPRLFHSSFLETPYFVEKDSSSVRTNDSTCFLVRQVPGDGGCLFHALSVCAVEAVSEQHADFDSKARALSNRLRRLAVDTLLRVESVVVEEGETINGQDLLAIAAESSGLKPEEYCWDMLRPQTWGSGVEIVALSNYFRRPIHVYGLTVAKHPYPNSSPFNTNSESSPSTKSNTNPLMGWFRAMTNPRRSSFMLKAYARFGSPTFDRRPPLCILCADGRFPHVKPGQQRAKGDHFLALFPVDRLATAGYGHKDRHKERTRNKGQDYSRLSVDDIVTLLKA